MTTRQCDAVTSHGVPMWWSKPEDAQPCDAPATFVVGGVEGSAEKTHHACARHVASALRAHCPLYVNGVVPVQCLDKEV